MQVANIGWKIKAYIYRYTVLTMHSYMYVAIYAWHAYIAIPYMARFAKKLSK